MTVYDLVSKIAKERHMTIKDVEMKAGIANGVIGKWRNGNPSMKSLIAVAKALEIPVQDLFVKR